MADFGDSELFSEFEKERETTNSFIHNDNKPSEARITFTLGGDSSSDESESDGENVTVPLCPITTAERENKTNSESNRLDNSITAKEILTRCSDEVGESTVASKGNGIETSFKILHERNKYSRYTKIIDSTRCVQDESSPCVQVLFQNNAFSRKYRPRIEQFITDLLEEEFARFGSQGEELPELPLQTSVPTCVDLNSKLPVELRTNTMWMAHAIIGNAQFHHLFLIDSRGWPLVNLNPSLTDGWEVPKYEQVYEDPLPAEEEDDCKPKGKKASRPKPSCFNCGGEHMMSDCKEPKDFTRIKNNRREFMDKHSPSMTKKLSLSANKIVEDKFEKFKPGIMSPALREALGLRPDQLPMHIYRMRLMGYPPGWLKEAEVNQSGLVMFDKDGREMNLHGESLEDGEVNQEEEEEVTVPEVQIDTKKIIEYPGFTVPVPAKVIDECAMFGMPPLQPHQLKNTLEVIVETADNEKKRKLEEEEEEKAKKFKRDNPEIEMELSEDEGDASSVVTNGSFVPPLPVETPPNRPPPPDSTPPVTPVSRHTQARYPPTPSDTEPPLPVDTPPCLPPLPDGTPPSTPRLSRASSLARENSQNSTPRSVSPSLEILEEQYKALVQQLGKEKEFITVDSCSGDDPESSATETEVCADDGKAVDRTLSRTSSVVSLEAADSPMSIRSQDSEILKMNSTFQARESVSREFSTPIMNRPNTFTSLPDVSKFGVGVEDHIPFENLSDSTGKFEKMRGLMKLIRSKSKTTTKRKK